MNGPRARETVQKLWNASKSLQGGGVSYYEYVTELTYLLLIKMMAEVRRDGKALEERLPKDCRWGALKDCKNDQRLEFYKNLLLNLGDIEKVKFPLINQVFTNAKTSLTSATALSTLVSTIDDVDWYTAERDGLGDLYEGLLEKTTSERKSKAGQYFTPRTLIDAIITVTKPKVGEIIQDPAAGTGGFLIAAHRAIMKETNDLTDVSEDISFSQRNGRYQGAELIAGTHRINTMNLLLHGIDQPIYCIDSLSSDANKFDKADLILTNPPFNKFPERVTRDDLAITLGTAKGPLPFVEHIINSLKIGGRAAIVVPDNVLFEDNVGRDLRRWVMDLCDLHTILRLPTGIFYAQGVKTNVLFLTKKSDLPIGATKTIWFYDLRSQSLNYGKTRSLTSESFDAFIDAFGDDPYGRSIRSDEGPGGRFRVFTREDVSKRNENLDIAWLSADSADVSDEPLQPDDIAVAIMNHLRSALAEINVVVDEFALKSNDSSLGFQRSFE